MNTITAKIKLLPDAKQVEQLHRTLTTGRDAMNFASEIAFANGHVSFMKLQKLAYHVETKRCMFLHANHVVTVLTMIE